MRKESTAATRPLWAVRFKGLRQNRGLSQSQIGEMLGVSQGQVAKWEKGDQTPSSAAFWKISQMCDEVEKEYWKKLAGPRDVEYVPTHSAVAILPLLRDAAAAGTPRAVNEQEIEERFEIPKKWLPSNGKYYAVRVFGDSMAPVLLDGHIVVVDIARREATQLVRSMVMARDEDGGVTIKWMRKAGLIFSLVPQNTSQDYDVQYLKPHGPFELVGEVVMWIGTPPKPRK
jgi:SOS-response transcriptional repressor LexA